jgi:hypothetical protein
VARRRLALLLDTRTDFTRFLSRRRLALLLDTRTNLGGGLLLGGAAGGPAAEN